MTPIKSECGGPRKRSDTLIIEFYASTRRDQIFAFAASYFSAPEQYVIATPENSSTDAPSAAASTSDSADALRARHGERYKWLLLITVMAGSMGSFMASTIASVAVPNISLDFHIGQDRTQWVASAFMVSMLPAHLLAPWLLARFGLRHTFVAAILIMMAAGIGAAFSGSFTLLIAMRVIEGAAAGILQPLPNIVIARAFAPGEQGRAMGMYGFGAVLAPTSAPTLGGYMIEWFSWRSIFLASTPFVLIAWFLARRYLPVTSGFMQAKPLDWLGLSWIALAIVCLLNGLAAFAHGGETISAWLLVGTALAGFAGFAHYQLRKTDPLLQIRLFTRTQFLFGAVVSFLFGFSIFAVTYLLPVFLQLALNYTPSNAGLVILPAGIALALCMPIGGRMADSMASRPLVIAGSLLFALSTFLTALVDRESSYWAIVAWAIIGRVGFSILHPALLLGSTQGLPRPEMPQALTLAIFLRHLGGAVGVSAAGILLDWRLSVYGVSKTVVGGNPDAILAAFEECFLFFAAVTLASVFVAWFMKPPQVKSTPAPRTA
ncbi:MAG: DHA2 family efflux MFS transporter permease subunit [Burkholderiales bacterium]